MANEQALKHIYALPQSILIEVDNTIGYPGVSAQEIFDFIKSKLKEDYPVYFNVEDVQEYMKVKTEAQQSNACVPIVIPSEKELIQSSKYVKIDRATEIDWNDKQKVLEYFRKSTMQQMDRLNEEAEKMTGREMYVSFHGMFAKYIETITKLMETEDKLKASFQNSNKTEEYFRNMFDRFYIVLKSVLQKNVDEEQMNAIVLDLEKALKLIKW